MENSSLQAHHIAPLLRSRYFEAEVFLRVFPQAAVHFHAVALNVELPFLLLVFLAAVVVEGLMAQGAPALLPLCAKKAVICGKNMSADVLGGWIRVTVFDVVGGRFGFYADDQHRYGPFLRFSR